MNQATFYLAQWVMIFLGSLFLCTILIVRRRWRGFPVFTAYMGYMAVFIPYLSLVYRFGSNTLYARAYWIDSILEFVLQLGVIWEIVRVVMRPTGTWIRDARKQFLFWSAAAITMAAALPWLVTPPYGNFFARLEIRCDFFFSIVFYILVAAVTRTSRSLGLGWRNHVIALVNGWTVFVSCLILVDGSHCYFGAERYYAELEGAKSTVFLLAIVYWIVQFWRDEPPRKPLSPELQAHILALHERIKKDLDIVKAQR